MGFAKKHFGQNFLQDPSVIDNISHVLQCKDRDHIVEIGPGEMALTSSLLTAKQLDLIEIDNDLINNLKKLAEKHSNITVYHTDALSFDYATLGDGLRIVGNLPYNISTPLLFHLIDYKEKIIDMHFMLQKEVVERICETPNSKDYGRLSVMMQYHCQCAQLFTVPATAFNPVPQVESAFVKIVPYTSLPHKAHNYQYFEELVRNAFSQRRKTIKNTLKGYVSFEELMELNLSPQARPEQLSVADYVALANYNR